MMANGAELGTGHVSIFATMKGFRSTVLKETQSAGEESSSLFSRLFKGVGSKTGNELGRNLKMSFDGSTGDLGSKAMGKLKSEVSSAARSMSSALLKQQDTAGAVRVAQTKLNEAIAKYGAGSSQAVAAEEKLASAQRKSEAASEKLTAAQDRLKAAKQAVADVKTGQVEAPKTSLFTRAIDRIRSSVKSLDSEKIDNVTGNLNRFSVKWGVVAGIAQAGAQRIMGLFSGMASSAMDASDSTDKFRSTLDFAKIDNGTIEKLIKSTQKYADLTVYDIADIRNVTSQLAANGVKGYGDLAEAAGNLNAVAGGNADTFKSVGMVLTQTAGAGKLTTENWNQMADAIPGASGKLQEAMKKNGAYTGNFRDAMAKGQITADEFNQAIMDLGMTDAAKQAAQSTSTFEGAIGNWQAAVTGFGQSVLTALKPQLTGAINFATDKLSGFTSWFTKTWDSVSGMVEKHQFAKAFQTAFHIDDATMDRLLDSFSGIRGGVKQVIDAVSPVKSTFTGANSGFSLLDRGLNGVSSTLNLVRPVLPILADLIKTFERLPQPVQTGIAATVLFGGQMRSVITPISGVVNILKTVTGGIGSVSGAIGGLISQRLSKTQAITGLADTLSNTAGSAESAAGSLGHTAGKVENIGAKAEGAVGKTGALSSLIGGFSPVGVAFGVAAAGIGVALAGIADDTEKTSKTVADYKQALSEGANATTKFFTQLSTGGEGALGFWDKFNSGQSVLTNGTLSGAADHAGISMKTVTDAVNGSGKALQDISGKAGNWWNQFTNPAAAAANVVKGQVEKMRDSYKETINAMVDYSTTAQGVNSASSMVQSKFSELSTTLKANGDDLSNNKGLTDASSQAIQSATDSLMANVQQQLAYGKANGTMAQSTQAAKNEIQQMRDQLTQTLESMGMSEQQAGAYADKLGLIPGNVGTTITENSAMTKGEVEAYLDTLGLTPKQKTTVMDALTAQANGDTNNLHANYRTLPKEVKSILSADNNDSVNKARVARDSVKSVPGSRHTGFSADNNDVINKASNAYGAVKSVPQSHTTNFFANLAGGAWDNIKKFMASGAGHSWFSTGGSVHRATGGQIPGFADGGGPSGYVQGPGTSTSDSIHAMLSNDEFVIRAWAAKRIGIENLYRLNATGKLPGGAVISSTPVVNQNFYITNKGVANPYVNGNILGRTAASSARTSLMGV
ncbi:tape measure protein [Bifidobacterium mongoliense]|uniref:tape measure protein n=1 Tax=Bifidobacterium mongoliense TaxID=518643 RepID=UPI0030ECD525